MSISTRTRFEVLKRDGFRCHYCGSTAMASPLHVDHVVPASKGGSDDPANLITACQDCNLGKSNVGLEDVRATGATDDAVERAREHAEQVRAYLEAQREVDAARHEVLVYVADLWISRVSKHWTEGVESHLRAAIHRHPLDHVARAIDAVARKGIRYETPQLKYFHGVLRNLSKEVE